MIESRLKELNEVMLGEEERVKETFDNMAEAIANKDEDGWTEDEEISDGEKTTVLTSWFKIHKEGKTYTFYIVDVIKDTKDSKNEGVKTICVINRGDSIRYFEDFEGANLPGIHYEENK